MGMNSKIRLVGWALCALAGFAVSGAAVAQSPRAVSITNAVYQEVVTTAPDGKVTKKLVPAKKVVPGGEVVYEMTYSNGGTQPATDFVIDNPLPAELTYVGGEPAPAAVSVDGGKTYGKLAEIKVMDADNKERPAQEADVTNVRWIVATLAPGASGKVVYRARVK